MVERINEYYTRKKITSILNPITDHFGCTYQFNYQYDFCNRLYLMILQLQLNGREEDVEFSFYEDDLMLAISRETLTAIGRLRENRKKTNWFWDWLKTFIDN